MNDPLIFKATEDTALTDVVMADARRQGCTCSPDLQLEHVHLAGREYLASVLYHDDYCPLSGATTQKEEP
jgi:hypothetical protein